MVYCETNVDGTIGGSYFSLLYLVKNLDRARYSPLVVFYTSHGLMDAFKNAGVEVFVWPKRSGYSFSERVASAPALVKVPILALQKALNVLSGYTIDAVARAIFLRRHRTDILHLNNSVLYNHDWMLAARLAGVACVSHERGINDFYPAVARFWSRRVDAIVCISDAVRQAMVKAGAGSGNLQTIHNGFDVNELRFATTSDALRQDLGIPADAEVVVMLGNLKAWKGQDTLVRAMAAVRRVHPKSRCVFVGATAPADQAFEHELRRLVSAAGLADCVVFAGYRAVVADFLRLADVVVHASILPEPFGRVVLEAMACRKPVVGSRAGGVLEIIDEKVTGLMFDPGDVLALAEAILRLLGDPALARRMGDAGHERLLRRFHIDRNTDATQNLYDRLVGQRVSSGAS